MLKLILIWLVISVIVGCLVGAFIRAGMGDSNE